MTRYDDVPDHPLAGVPQAVLDVSRRVLREAAEERDVDPELAEPLADLIVWRLHESGYVTWPGRVPDRESLVLAVLSAQAWQSGEDGRSVAEYLVDTVVLPLLAGMVGPSRPTTGTARSTSGAATRNEVHGTVTGSVIQGDRFGDVRLG